MTILLSGGSGFVGKHLAARLERDGHRIHNAYRGIDLDTWFDNWDYPPSIDAVINCAGEITKQGEMFESNVALTQRLLDFAQDRVSKFIQIGSSSEYGRMGEPRREDAICTPTDLYSATKLAATALCQGFASQHKMDICIARPFSLYGPGDTPRKLIPRLYQSCMNWTPISVGAGRQDYLYIDDFIDGLVLLLGLPSEKTKGQIVNLGTGVDTANTGVLKLMEDVTGRKAHAMVTDGYAPNWVADITKARALGWQPRFTLEQGLTELIKHETS